MSKTQPGFVQTEKNKKQKKQKQKQKNEPLQSVKNTSLQSFSKTESRKKNYRTVLNMFLP